MMDLLQTTFHLARQLGTLRAPHGVSHVYDPLLYMWDAHAMWLRRYIITPSSVARRPYLILGMNPGPWGMLQTGVPFGDVPNARLLLGKPLHSPSPAPGIGLHPQRPVQGFACTRVEVSGDRLWGGLANVWHVPTDETYEDQLERVLADCFAMNFCPLAFFAGDNGVNVTPEDFTKKTVKGQPNPYYDPEYVAQLNGLCLPYLRAIMDAMQVEVVLGIGRYAEAKAKIAAALQPANRRAKVLYLTHPSPLATSSAGEWATMARKTMGEAGVLP